MWQGAWRVPRPTKPAVETGATNVAPEHALAEASACVLSARSCSKYQGTSQNNLATKQNSRFKQDMCEYRSQGNRSILTVGSKVRTLILSAQGRPAVKLDVSGA